MTSLQVTPLVFCTARPDGTDCGDAVKLGDPPQDWEPATATSTGKRRHRRRAGHVGDGVVRVRTAPEHEDA